MRAHRLLVVALAVPLLAQEGEPPLEVDPAEPCEPLPVWLAHRRPATPAITWEVHTRAISETEGEPASTSSTTVVLELTWEKELKKGGQRVACTVRRYAVEEHEPGPATKEQEELEAARQAALAAIEGSRAEVDLASDGRVLERRGDVASFAEEVLFELPAGELEPGQSWTSERTWEGMRIETTFTYEGVVARGERRLARLRIAKELQRPPREQPALEGFEVETRTEYEGGPRYLLIDVFDGTLVAMTPETIVTRTRMSYQGETSEVTLASTRTVRRVAQR